MRKKKSRENSVSFKKVNFNQPYTAFYHYHPDINPPLNKPYTAFYYYHPDIPFPTILFSNTVKGKL